MNLEEAQEKLKELKRKEEELKEMIENKKKEYWAAEIIYKNPDIAEYHLLGRMSCEAARDWSNNMLYTHDCIRTVYFWGMSHEQYEAWKIAHDYQELRRRVEHHLLSTKPHEVDSDYVKGVDIDDLVEKDISPIDLDKYNIIAEDE